MSYYFIYMLCSIGMVTIIDTLGSIASRKLNFNYGYFTILSISVYVFTAYLIVKETGYWTITIFSIMLIGIYDATIGWKISQKLNANYGEYKEYSDKLTLANRLYTLLLFSIITAGVGIFLANK